MDFENPASNCILNNLLKFQNTNLDFKNLPESLKYYSLPNFKKHFKYSGLNQD